MVCDANRSHAVDDDRFLVLARSQHIDLLSWLIQAHRVKVTLVVFGAHSAARRIKRSRRVELLD